MRIGQTSLVVFGSRVVGSALGFAATVFFTQELGASLFGQYSLVLALVAWATIASLAGFDGAITKRLSEDEDRGEHFIAGATALGVGFVVVSIVLVTAGEFVNAYLCGPLVQFVLLILFVRILSTLATAGLSGTHLVHVTGVLIPVRMLFRSVTQIGLILLGFGLTGMLAGHVVGYVVVAAVGLWIVPLSVIMPSVRHFESLLSYARYSWLGTVESRAFDWIDITVLGLFVSSELVGFYSASWAISAFFLSFSISISSTIFPEISELSIGGDHRSVKSIVEDSLRFAGLLLIPGIVGSVLLGEQILGIYGEEFGRGSVVLVILLASVLFRSYQKQLITAINALDHPRLTFRTNVAFISVNVVLNVLLVLALGWRGAAVATAVSAVVGVGLGYRYLSQILDFEFPYRDVALQWVAATAMGIGVLCLQWLYRSIGIASRGIVVITGLVGGGVVIYLIVLFGISNRFRSVVQNNIPRVIE